ncbi:hypothetical protein LPJ53_004025, partial [Coemansia erecta]
MHTVKTREVDEELVEGGIVHELSFMQLITGRGDMLKDSRGEPAKSLVPTQHMK